MLGEEVKPKSAEDLLAEAASDAMASLRSLSNFANEAEVRSAEIRLAAAKTLLETWMRVREASARPVIGVDPGRALAAMNRMAGAESTDAVVSEILGTEPDEETDRAEGNGSIKETALKSPPKAKAAPKSVPKAAAPARPSISRAPDFSALKEVPRKYWITLGVAASILGMVGLLSLGGGQPTPAELLASALKSSDADVRGRAVAALCAHTDSKTAEALRQLVAETKDASATELGLQSLADRSDSQSLPLFLDAMASSQRSLRGLGYKSVRKLMGIGEQNDLGYDPDGPQDRCVSVARTLRDQYNKTLQESAATRRSGTPAY